MPSNPAIVEILKAAEKRRELGRDTYGDEHYKEVSMLDNAEEELLDLINYAIFGILKVQGIREKLNNSLNNL